MNEQYLGDTRDDFLKEEGLYESLNWELITAISRLYVPKKNERAFAAADFALRQKILILTEEHQD